MSVIDVQGDPVLDAIVRTIVERFEPVRIVLFGSHARGDANAESDYDLMVEVEDAHPERVEKLIGEVLFELDFDVDAVVTTAETYRVERHDVGLLAYQIEREGRTLYVRDRSTAPAAFPRRKVREPRPARPRSVEMWVRRAENDFSVAELTFVNAPVVTDATCFHAHQAAEKYLKAVVVWTGRPPPRTHRLGRILKRCPGLVQDAAVRRACSVLLVLYRCSRYAESREPTVDEARAAIAATRVVREAARDALGL